MIRLEKTVEQSVVKFRERGEWWNLEDGAQGMKDSDGNQLEVVDGKPILRVFMQGEVRTWKRGYA